MARREGKTRDAPWHLPQPVSKKLLLRSRLSHGLELFDIA